VTALTAGLAQLRCDVNSISEGHFMALDVGSSTEHLENLVKKIMREKDPVKFDELGSEIWRVLQEREREQQALTARTS
jgi:hypothetical protein